MRLEAYPVDGVESVTSRVKPAKRYIVWQRSINAPSTVKWSGHWSSILRKKKDEEKKPSLYNVRRVSIGKTEQLDTLARACGELYSRTVVSYWRMVRKHGLWLQPKHLMRWHTSDQLHAHTSDATVQAFFAALNSCGGSP